MGQTETTKGGRVATTAVGGLIAAPLSYFVGKVVEKWGILDPLANQIGGWLKINVSSSAVVLVVASFVFALLYGLLLIRIWRPRHVFDTERGEGLKLGDTAEAEIVSKPTRRVGLTETQRERCSVALTELFDFIGGDLVRYRARLNEIQYADAPGLPAVRADLEPHVKRAGDIWHAHHLYFDIMDGLDMQPVLQTLGALRNPLAKYQDSLEWPPEARGDRIQEVHRCAMAFDVAINAALRDIRDRQERFINV